MASVNSLLLAFSTRCQRISATFLLWVMLLTQVDGRNQSDEVQTLLQFKNSLTGTAYHLDGFFTTNAGGYWSSWKSEDPTPCAWVGVGCTFNSTVEQLDLSSWGLTHLESTGLIYLSHLRDLRQLDLSSNRLGSNNIRIPEEIGFLTALTRLDLSGNQFSGAIPRNISSCRNLRYISLERNQLEGEIPSLRGLTNLQVLHLADNQLTGPFPKDLGEIDCLVSIDLSGNKLNGEIPSLSNSTNLLSMRLDNNNFTGFEGAWLSSTRGLEYLSVAENELEGMLPHNITTMRNLTFLNLSGNRLSGEIPVGFSNQAKNNLWLDLSQNRFTGEIPPDLLKVNISLGTVFEDLLLAQRAVNLSHNFLSGNIPSEEIYSFVVLDLSYNELSGPIPFFFRNGNTSVYSLFLQNNSLSGDILDFLLDNPGLSRTDELRLQGNLFTGDLSRLITEGNFSNNLQSLDLSNNNLGMSVATKAIPDPLRATLEILLNPGIIQEVRLGGNNFSGISLPASPFLVPSLQVLDLSNSHLTGDLSGFVNSTCLPALQILNLSKNEVSGSIPASILMLPNLTVLDVSYNNLSGSVPVIPSNSSLDYNAIFFMGNEELCGGPLAPCPQALITERASVQLEWWVLLLIIGGSAVIAAGSCLAATWRWRVYRKQHQQDADLIKTLLERESASLMSLRELRKATENFAESTQIGEGGFGTVYTGKLSNGTVVAIKRRKSEGSEKDKTQFLNEVRILSQVNHRYLVKLLGCCMENKIALLVFEFVPNGTLQDHLRGKSGAVRLSWKQRLNIAVQTADALSYLHSAATFPIYHRDVKSANILLTDDLDAKVADFGISRLAPVKATHISTVAIQGTMGYIDPEYYTTFQLTDKSDVYSFGVVLLELISAQPAIDFSRRGEDTSLVNFADPQVVRGDLQELVDPALLDTYSDEAGFGRESILNVGRLARKCVDMRSKARPSMKEVLQDLQNLWFELNNNTILANGGPVSEDDCCEDARSDHHVFFSRSSFGDSSSFALEKDEPSSIQKSGFSRPSSFRQRTK